MRFDWSGGRIANGRLVLVTDQRRCVLRYGAVEDGAAVASLLEKPSLCKMSRALEDWELWGAATMVVKQHGDQAPTFVAERIGALALAGDQQGIETWKKIAARIEQLRAEGPAKH